MMSANCRSIDAACMIKVAGASTVRGAEVDALALDQIIWSGLANVCEK
jgi:hypothetical protein